MSKVIDLIEQQFGRLIVLQRADNSKRGQSRWLCRCDCGKKIIIQGGNLKNGHTKSCGCLRKEIMTKHGHIKRGIKDGFYQSWQNMKDRCTNPNHKYYKDYGGRGITVCGEWLHSFSNFKRDNLDWKPGLTIERKDKNGNYCPENCKWATRKEQGRNKRNNRYETYKGKRWLFIELCKEHNISYHIVYNRYYGLGWTLEDALTIPIGQRRKKK